MEVDIYLTVMQVLRGDKYWCQFSSNQCNFLSLDAAACWSIVIFLNKLGHFYLKIMIQRGWHWVDMNLHIDYLYLSCTSVSLKKSNKCTPSNTCFIIFDFSSQISVAFMVKYECFLIAPWKQISLNFLRGLILSLFFCIRLREYDSLS